MKNLSKLIAEGSIAMLALAITGAASTAFAHGNAHESPKKASSAIAAEEHPFGREGDPQHVTRTIAVHMNDSMRFDPSHLSVKQGETIRFVVTNKGKVMHEMVLGTLGELKTHGELMRKNPEMEHAEAYMAHVAAGGQQEMIWQFTQPGEFHYGCLLPGHFEAGMIGKLTVTKG